MAELLDNKGDLKKRVFLHALYWSFFSAVWMFLFWRCRYGYADADESFYLTIPYRLYQGDKLFLHEWHLSQTSSLLLWPIMRIYLAFFSDTTGIALHFRWIFTAVWGFTALFVEKRLKRFSDTGAKLSAVVFLIFTSNGVMALNYNTFGILLLLSSCILCISSDSKCRIQFFCSGLLFAGAVMCCPYLLILFLCSSLTALAAFFMNRKDLACCWCFASLGAITAFILFCIYLLSKAPLLDYVKVFPFLLQDPEHELVSVFQKTWTLFYSASLSSPIFMPGMGLAAVVTIAAYLFGKHREGFIIVCAISLGLLISYWANEKALLNQLMFPLSVVGLYCVIVSNDRINRRIFVGLWLPGFVYGFCINLSSNQYFFAFSSVSLLMSIASIIIACRYIESERNIHAGSSTLIREKCLILVFSVLMVVQIGTELDFRYEKVFWDSEDIHKQTILIETGPNRGIRVSDNKYAFYKQATADLAEICSKPEVNKILIISNQSGLYLMAEREYATYSAWLYSLDTLYQYYFLFPEKKPDAVYITGIYYFQAIPELLENGFEIDKIDENAETAILYPARMVSGYT